MLCEECGKQPAEVVLTTVVNGQSTTRHLCRECVKKYKAGDIQAVLAAVLSTMAQKQQTPDITCPNCGETYAEFQKSGMLGCAECYQAFRKELTPLITRVQGRAQHAGRRPPVSEEEQARINEMESLRARMEAAVAEENFEEAAKLRDALRALTPAKEEKA
ncbi:MAG: UvrB/UvrC motif-containing protein [Clostridia bacterium]|nr:excinuclease ABC subunit B [Clostridiales bacterium]MBQ2978321.1 UvrB/UvrC motif-containing protein [Clostridia bacterium]MDD6682535.1 UvrB/UvrC motif-containing protein [Clostridiales bacterium]